MLEVGALVPDWEAIIVSVNHSQIGGTGGSVGTAWAGGHMDGTAIHELGHLFNLGDEYPYLERDVTAARRGRDVYTGPPPSSGEPDDRHQSDDHQVGGLHRRSDADADDGQTRIPPSAMRR